MMRLLYFVLLCVFLCVAPLARAADLTGAGATFPAPLYQKWFQSYEQQRPGAHFSYQAIGSVAGLAKLRERAVDFAASDIPIADERFEKYPTVAGAVVPIYNIAGFNGDLRFPQQVLAEIYLGKIRKWNDPLLAKANPHVHLPDAEIVPVHRNDGSGTTYVFTHYLAKISPDWTQQGDRIAWPSGQGAEGSEGVVEMVRQTPNSIGYVEFIYALHSHLSYGAVRNHAGRYVAADLQSIGTAAATAGEDLSILDAPGEDAYPLAAFTYFLVPHDAGSALRDFLVWMLDQGQKQAPALGYTPLPEQIAARQRARLK